MIQADEIPAEILAKRIPYRDGFLTKIYDSSVNADRIVYKRPVSPGSVAYLTLTVTKKEKQMYEEIIKARRTQ